MVHPEPKPQVGHLVEALMQVLLPLVTSVQDMVVPEQEAAGMADIILVALDGMEQEEDQALSGHLILKTTFQTVTQ